MIGQYLSNANESVTVFVLQKKFGTKALYSSQNILQKVSKSPLHRILRHMHGALNIDKNNN